MSQTMLLVCVLLSLYKGMLADKIALVTFSTKSVSLPMALLRTVVTRVGFCGDTRSGILWRQPLSCDASAAVTGLGENLVQMRMETKKTGLQRKLVEFSTGNLVKT